MGGTSQFTTSMHMFAKEPELDEDLDQKVDESPSPASNSFAK